jgi:hypothetical protein
MNGYEAACIISQAPDACRYPYAVAWTEGQIPWHNHDKTYGTFVTPDRRPNWWDDNRQLDSTGINGPVVTIPGGPNNWELSDYHHPSVGMWMYLSTGERRYLDNLQSVASWTLMYSSPGKRGGTYANAYVGQAPDAPTKPYLLENCGGTDTTTRGLAWKLRDLENAAWASPDGTYEKSIFSDAITVNYKWRTSMSAQKVGQLFVGEMSGWGCTQTDNIQGYMADYLGNVIGWGAMMGEPWSADARNYAKLFSGWEVQRYFPHTNWPVNPYGAYDEYEIISSVDGSVIKTWSELRNEKDRRIAANGPGSTSAYTDAYMKIMGLSAINSMYNGMGKDADAAQAAATIQSIWGSIDLPAWNHADRWSFRITQMP